MKYYIVDAFTKEMFKGNPAAVCIPEKELSKETMQNIAAEFNLSETAFIKKNGNSYDLRWFTPEKEVDLCGHATLAGAFVINNFIDKKASEIEFNTLSGKLSVTKNDNMLNLNFPAKIPKKAEISPLMEKAIGTYIQEAHASARDLMLRLESVEQIKKLKPDFESVKKLGFFGVIVTAKGPDTDYVLRFFAPDASVPEDPATGSAHCTLIPYWSNRLHKDYMTSIQLSKRGGYFYCRNLQNRVQIGGYAVLYSEGDIKI